MRSLQVYTDITPDGLLAIWLGKDSKSVDFTLTLDDLAYLLDALQCKQIDMKARDVK